MRWVTLALVFQLPLGTTEPPKALTVTGILLGAEGGNRIGSLRILVNEQVWVVGRTPETLFDENVLAHRLRVGTRIQCHLLAETDGAPSERRFRAARVRVVDAPKTKWQKLGAEVEEMLVGFGSAPRCMELLRKYALLDAQSISVLEEACESAAKSGSLSIWGTEAWAVAEVKKQRIVVWSSPLIFRDAQFGLELQYEDRQKQVRLLRASLIDADQYYQLFLDRNK